MLQVVPDSIDDLNHLRRLIAEEALMTDIQVNEERLKENTQDTQLRIYLARRFLRTGNLPNAENMFRSVLDPAMKSSATDSAIAHHELGLLQMARGDPESALEHLLKALTYHQQLGIDLNTAVEHYYLGKVCATLSRFPQAAKHNRSAVALNPKDSDYATALAELPATPPEIGSGQIKNKTR